MCLFLSCEALLQGLDLYELARIARRVALEPCIAGTLFRFPEALEQALPGCVWPVHGFFSDLLNSAPFYEVVCTLEVVGPPAVKLEEEGGGFQRLFRSLDRDQEIGLADLLSCSSS